MMARFWAANLGCWRCNLNLFGLRQSHVSVSGVIEECDVCIPAPAWAPNHHDDRAVGVEGVQIL